jgi:hypothetical protein
MWLLALTGVFMGWRRYGPGSWFFRIKSAIMLLVVLNAHVLVVPAGREATELAANSAAAGKLLQAYHAAYMRETIFGTVNVILILAAASAGVWRIGTQRS